MGKNKYSKSFEIALSAIASAIAVIFLWLGMVPYLTGFGYLVGIFALMLPLSKQFFLGGFLAYLSTCILTLVLGAVAQFWNLVPFIIFFGLHPLVNCLQIRFKINRWLAFAVKAVWFIGMLFVGYFMMLYGFIGGSILQHPFFERLNFYIYILIPVVGAVIFLIYDYLIFRCQILVNSLVYRIRK